MKILIELWLDGYNTQEEMYAACREMVEENLNMTAGSVEILWAEKPPKP